MLSTNTVFNLGKATCTAFIPWSWLQVQPSSATGPVWPKAMTAFSAGTAGSGLAAVAGRISFGIINDVPAAAPRFSRPRRERLRRSIMLNPSDCDALTVTFQANNWHGVFRSNRLIPSAPTQQLCQASLIGQKLFQMHDVRNRGYLRTIMMRQRQHLTGCF